MKCNNPGHQSSIDLVTRTIRDIMPTSDLPRMSMAQELPSNQSARNSFFQLGTWLEDYIHKLDRGMTLAA
eukprot:12905581-Prorocentrum_lima.AAC.1